MKVAISAHFDIARPIMFIKMGDDELSGLIDNFAGVFTGYQAGRKTGTPVYFTNYEELEYDGADAVARSLDKETLVIVVDTTTDAEGRDAYIGNSYNINVEALKPCFSDRVLFRDGFYEETEDETFIYGRKYNLKTFYFGVPISGDYHDVNNRLAIQAVDRAAHVLVDLINRFRGK